MEKIRIENFAGIELLDIDIKPITLVIGPQAVGKSIVAKLLLFFKSSFSVVYKSIYKHEDQSALDHRLQEMFIRFFPKDNWSHSDFCITYTLDSIRISAEYKNKRLYVHFSRSITKNFATIRKNFTQYIEQNQNNEDKPKLLGKKSVDAYFRRLFYETLPANVPDGQLFIPAGRTSLAYIQKNIFSRLRENEGLDPLIVEFGDFYENLKNIDIFGNEQTRIQHALELHNESESEEKKSHQPDNTFIKLVADLLNGVYVTESESYHLLHSDNRAVNVLYASSGQQESLPIILTLQFIYTIPIFKIMDKKYPSIYIEEPEAHLFPSSQKKIVQLIARVFNRLGPEIQFFITTHSPYILSSFNNLIQAGVLAKRKPKKREAINAIVPKEEQIQPEMVAAYSLNDGKAVSIMDEKSGLISRTILDAITNEITDDFRKLKTL